MMKNKKVLGIIAIAAIIGFAMFGCDNDTDGNTNVDPCANGHNFGDDSDWVEDAIAATCIHPSYDTKACKNANCGETEDRTGSHPALGHDLPGAYAATCMADGFTGIGTCNRCNEDLTGEPLDKDPDNHDFSGEPVITPATCTEVGEEVINCGNNGCTKKHETVLDALGEHIVTITEWTALSTQCERENCSDTIGLAECIKKSAYAGTAADPVLLKVSIELTGMGTGTTSGTAFSQLLTALTTGGKLVALDLSGSTRSSNGAFTTGTTSSQSAPGLAGLRQIVSIVLPSTTITAISTNTFRNCTNLTSVTIPNTVTNINENAFYGCSSLTSVNIPSSVTNIGPRAFYGCSSITVDAENQHYTSQDGILYNKTMTELIAVFGITTGTVIIPNSVTSIGTYAFQNCTSLTSVTIPDSVTSIGAYAFRGCSSLTSITIPDSVTSIFSYAFSGCSSLTSITIPDSVTIIGGGAFENCSGLTSVTIPNSVTSIGGQAFRGCKSLTSVTIPNSVTGISEAAFYECSSLTSVTIPNSVTGIGDGAFQNCTSLTSVTIPNSVTGIGSSAFQNCTNLRSVTFERADTTFGNDNYVFPNGTSLYTAYITNGGGIGTYIRTGTTWAKQE